MTAKLRQLPVFLILSIALNAFLIGVLVMGFLAGPDRGGERRGRPDPDFEIIRGIAEVRGEGSRQALRHAFREAFRDTSDERDALRAARGRLVDALDGDTFSEDAIDAAFAEIRRADAAVKASFHEVLSRELGRLSEAERAALAARLEDFERRRGRGRRGERRRED